MLSRDQVSSHVLDHLGLVAAVMDKVGLIKRVDGRLPLAMNKGSIVTMGERVAAMILNGLGFMDDRLYMFPEFLENEPVGRLFGPQVSAEHFNDDALGRCLDAIYAYGVTQLFSELAFEIGVAFGLIGKTSRMDTTSLVVYGDYEGSDDSEDFHITHGYSKAGCSDLKQVVLNLATTGKANLPIWMAAHSGNASDKVVLPQAAERMKQFASALKEAPAFLFVGDSALYERCLERAGDMLWLSRVPHSHSKAKEYLGLDQEIDWTELDDPNYRISQAFRHSYKGVSQRWVMVFSEHAYQRECITLEKKIAQEQEAMSKKLWHLGNTPFACEQDALKALKPLVKQLKYHTVSHHLKAVHHYNGKGRPKKDSKPEVVQFHLVATLSQDTAAIAQQRLTKGRFILATNQLDETLLANADMLYEYKQQTHTEAGFRFIKGLRCREFS